MSMGHNIGAGQLRAFIDRVLRLKEEQDALSADIREVYAEAKGEGFDKTALGQVVAHLRKVGKKGADAVNEANTIFDMYLSAYQGGDEQPSRTHAYAREAETPAPERKAAGSAPRNEGSKGANVGGENVDRSASARPSGQPVGAQPEGLESGKIVERNTSGPDAKRAPHSDEEPFEPPAFLAKPKTAADYRPNCLNPENCAASGLSHCYSCTKAAAEGVPA